jgi:hypothetical protein
MKWETKINILVIAGLVGGPALNHYAGPWGAILWIVALVFAGSYMDAREENKRLRSELEPHRKPHPWEHNFRKAEKDEPKEGGK